MIDIRHNEFWPKGRATVFMANEDGCSIYFGTREEGTSKLRDVHDDIQYVCINTEDWDATVEWLKGMDILQPAN